jgi:hypothetical protein
MWLSGALYFRRAAFNPPERRQDETYFHLRVGVFAVPHFAQIEDEMGTVLSIASFSCTNHV